MQPIRNTHNALTPALLKNAAINPANARRGPRWPWPRFRSVCAGLALVWRRAGANLAARKFLRLAFAVL